MKLGNMAGFGQTLGQKKNPLHFRVDPGLVGRLDELVSFTDVVRHGIQAWRKSALDDTLYRKIQKMEVEFDSDRTQPMQKYDASIQTCKVALIVDLRIKESTVVLGGWLLVRLSLLYQNSKQTGHPSQKPLRQVASRRFLGREGRSNIKILN